MSYAIRAWHGDTLPRAIETAKEDIANAERLGCHFLAETLRKRLAELEAALR